MEDEIEEKVVNGNYSLLAADQAVIMRSRQQLKTYIYVVVR